VSVFVCVCRSVFSVDVKTTASDGVVLYFANTLHVDFFSLYFKDGKLNFAFNCGSGAARATSDFTYNDDFWHTVPLLSPHEYSFKGKERKSICRALFWPRWYTQSAQAWITQFYLQITPCLPFLREHSPDVTTTGTEAADIQLQLTTHLSTPKG